jgi:ParB family chromosome partitioning protein
VVNPRVRSTTTFKEIIENIGEIGLKRPITVRRREGDSGREYDLVCGQGRLEAYATLGQTDIPAVVIDASPADCLLMSLVENCARRQHSALDLLRDIEGLSRRGYSDAEIGRKTGLSTDYVKDVNRLIDAGEHRLLRAVEAGHIPLSLAVRIATEDIGVQEALQQAYEGNVLRGSKLLAAKRVLEQRQSRKRRVDGGVRHRPTMSGDALLRAYRDDVDKKRLLIRRAEATKEKLVFAIEALKALFSDENFVTLLRAEGLETLPKNIADRLFRIA